MIFICCLFSRIRFIRRQGCRPQAGLCLKEKGCRRALCVSDNDICVDKERYEGFCDGLGKDRVDFLMVPMQKEKRLAYYQEHLKQIQEYEAIFAVSDSYAIELMHFLAVQGIRVPEDMMVIGFDDMPICRTNTPTLTSVRQDVKRRAQIANYLLQADFE